MMLQTIIMPNCIGSFAGGHSVSIHHGNPRSSLHLNWLVLKVCLLHVRVSAHNSEAIKLDKRRDRTEGGISGSVWSSAAKDLLLQILG
jgi:hypothetical protein